MKKLKFSLLTLIIFTVSCFAQKSIEPSITADYFNYVISLSKLDGLVQVEKVKKIDDANYDKLLNASKRVTNENLVNATEVELVFKDKKFTIYTFPISDNDGIAFLEDDTFNLDPNEVDVHISSDMSYSWNSSSTESRFRGISRNCTKGGAQIAAIGAIIAFGGFFGCPPCPFVGAAFVVLGSMSAFCP